MLVVWRWGFRGGAALATIATVLLLAGCGPV